MIGALADGFLWSGSTDRRGFLFATGLFFVLSVALAVAVSSTGPFGLVASVLFVVLGLLLYPLVGITVRRLHNLGLSGGWAFLLLVPFVGLGLILMLLILPDQNRPHRPGPFLIARFGQLVVLAVALLVASRVWWAPFWIPTASMKPNLLPGDYVIATRVMGAPEPGRIYIFRPLNQNAAFAKRLIGMPGDVVQTIGGVVQLNGTPVPQEALGEYREPYVQTGPSRVLPTCINVGVALGTDCIKVQQRELLPGSTGYKVLDIRETVLDDAGPFDVPDWGAFFMGDNRDNSIDSRVPVRAGGIGTVPVDNIVARVDRVLFSSAGSTLLSVWSWRGDRYWKRVE